MRTEAAASVARLLETYPEFPRRTREELTFWLGPERRERILRALRDAGVPIPEDDAGADPPPERGPRAAPVKSAR
jgi:hypothetical protein